MNIKKHIDTVQIVPKNTVNLILRIPPELHKKLRENCYKKEISMQCFVIKSIEKNLEVKNRVERNKQ